MAKTTGFIDEDFLLQTPFARTLYHDFVKDLPIIDYHNHLPPDQIAGNHQFENITRAWLAGDHYKWRAMRTLGVDEEYITGKAPDRLKFKKWAETVPHTARNPLFHWTQLELRRYFELDELLNKDNADRIFEETSAKLRQPSHSTLSLLSMMQVELVCTTDDPADSLEHHQKASASLQDLKMLPAFRPDKAYALQDLATYRDYLGRLEAVAGKSISSFSDLLLVLEQRIDYFHARGCRLADHGLEHMPSPAGDAEEIFLKIREDRTLAPSEKEGFAYEVLQQLCQWYHRKGWVQQFHLGALRNTNKRRLRELGADTGFDSIGDFPQARSLANFLNSLEEKDALAKTVLYNLNPSDNEVMATMTGNFNGEGLKAKLQWGSAWWYLDQKDGMEKQLNTLSNMGLLSCFIGMLTDSRSFLSFPRHEYFRRTLCNLIGGDVARGELPADEAWLGSLVQDVCYRNARNYFPF